MRIAVLASGSSGNALVVSSESTAILVDAGISARRLSGALSDGRASSQQLAAVLVTHEHADHVSGLTVLTRTRSLPVLATAGTHAALRGRLGRGAERRVVEPGRPAEVGGLRITCFGTSHDSVDPVGFTIEDARARVTVATDLGVVGRNVRHHLAAADCVVLEFNHDERMLLDGPYPWPLKQRIMSNVGHLSNRAASREIESLADAPIAVLVLAHLSKENNHPDVAGEAALAALARVGRSDVRVLIPDERGLPGVLNVEGDGSAAVRSVLEGVTSECRE